MLVLGTLGLYWPARHYEFVEHDDPIGHALLHEATWALADRIPVGFP